MKIVLIVLILLAACSCGAFDRAAANFTGNASQTCFRGVLYLQFTSGAAVALDKNGMPLTCAN